jgi:hypothetical protein
MEILQNTILKLVVRQGPDSDRQVLVLDSGELGYTVDLKRLYVGDGFLSGGNVVGNLFVGDAPTITDPTLYPSVIGDSAFATDTNKLYVLKTGTGSNEADWLLVGGVYSSGTSQITISADNVMMLNPLSAGYISSDAVEQPLYINSGRIALAGLSANAFTTDSLTPSIILSGGRLRVAPLSAGYFSTDALSAPLGLNQGKLTLRPLSAGNFSHDSVSAPLTITDGKISLSSFIPANVLTTKTLKTGSGLDLYFDGYDYSLSAINPLSGNLVIESNQMYTRFVGASGIEEASKGFTGVYALSIGHYRLPFAKPLQTDQYIVMAQIYGTDSFGYEPRVIYMGTDHCDIKILNSGGNTMDANIMVKIDY